MTTRRITRELLIDLRLDRREYGIEPAQVGLNAIKPNICLRSFGLRQALPKLRLLAAHPYPEKYVVS